MQSVNAVSAECGIWEEQAEQTVFAEDVCGNGPTNSALRSREAPTMKFNTAHRGVPLPIHLFIFAGVDKRAMPQRTGNPTITAE